MTAGFTHTKIKKKKLTAMDRLMLDTNIVCTLSYAIQNISELSQSEIEDVISAIEDGIESKDEQVKVTIQNFYETLSLTDLEESHPLVKVMVLFNN